MSKPPRTANPLETIAQDIGREFADTAKQTVREFAGAVSPNEFVKSVYAPCEGTAVAETPTEVANQQRTHEQKDQAEIAALRNQYFAHVQEESAHARSALQQEEEGRDQQEQQDIQLQKEIAAQESAVQQDAPHGKVHRSILGGKPKKTGGMHVPQTNFETKSNKGK